MRGFVINRFRGDPALLGDATAELERRCGVPTLGVVPMVPGVDLDAEDSLALDRWSTDAVRPGEGMASTSPPSGSRASPTSATSTRCASSPVWPCAG